MIFSINKNNFRFVILFSILVLLIHTAESSGMNMPSLNLGKDSLKLKSTNQTLNKHRFIINSRLGSPFIDSYLETSIGAAQSMDLKIPQLTIDSVKVPEVRGELVYSSLGFEFQQAIREWMAFRVRVEILGRLGTKAGTLISQGVNFSGGYEFGWMFKLMQSRKFILSGEAQVSNQSVTTVDIKRFVEGIIDSGKITKSNQLVGTTPFVTGGGALNCAYAFNETYGFTGNLRVRYGESVKRGNDDDWYLEYGAAFDANLLPGTKVPIGFLLGFYHHSLTASTQQISREPNDILFQINYTGRDDLGLGLEGSYQFYKPEGFENSIKFIYLNLNMRYFF